MILIKESTLNRVIKEQGWGNSNINGASVINMRKKRKLRHYYGKPHSVPTNKGFFYDKEDLEKLWEEFGVKFDVKNIYPKYYVEVKDPKKEGFEYIPVNGHNKEISDVVSSASQ